MLLDEIRLLAIKTHILATEAEFEEMKLILKRLEEFNNEITQF